MLYSSFFALAVNTACRGCGGNVGGRGVGGLKAVSGDGGNDMGWGRNTQASASTIAGEEGGPRTLNDPRMGWEEGGHGEKSYNAYQHPTTFQKLWTSGLGDVSL